MMLMLLPAVSMAQTGQSLIGNPLLSPAKIKEVKRQIADAARRESDGAPSAPQQPVAMQPPIQAPMPMAAMSAFPQMGGMRPEPSPAEMAKTAMSRLKVMAVAGKSALLATVPAEQNSNQAQAQALAMQMPSAAGFPPMQPNMQMSAAQPTTPQFVRRSSSTMVRDQQPVFVEGFDVIPVIRGDSVRLVLAASPQETVFYGAVQPSAQSPSSAVATSAQEKPSATYANGIGPDATSMTSQNGASGGQPAGQQPTQQGLRPRNAGTGDGF